MKSNLLKSSLLLSSVELCRKGRNTEWQREDRIESSCGRKIRNANTEPPETSVPFALTLWLKYHMIYLLYQPAAELQHSSTMHGELGSGAGCTKYLKLRFSFKVRIKAPLK